MSVIETNNLQKRYQVGENSVHAVDGVDLNIREGEFVCISGRSGSGKSTLLSLLAGLESPTDGEVILMGEHLEQMNEQERGRFRRDHIGFTTRGMGNLEYMAKAMMRDFTGLLLSRRWGCRRPPRTPGRPAGPPPGSAGPARPGRPGSRGRSPFRRRTARW